MVGNILSRSLSTGPWWVVDADKAEIFTLPTEIPGAVEHLQEMRDWFYRRRLALRKQQLEREEAERRRLEKEVFRARRIAATVEEKKRKEAAAAAAQSRKAKLAAASAKKKEKAKAQTTAAPPAPAAVPREKSAVVKKKTEEGAAKLGWATTGETDGTAAGVPSHYAAAKPHEERGSAPPSKTGEATDQGPGAARGELAAPEAGEIRSGLEKPVSVNRKNFGELQQQEKGQEEQQRREVRAEAESAVRFAGAQPREGHPASYNKVSSGGVRAQKGPPPTGPRHTTDGGVPLHAAPLLSGRLHRFTPQ